MNSHVPHCVRRDEPSLSFCSNPSFSAQITKKALHKCKAFDLSGEGGIRTPGGLPHAGFQDQCIRPLCHFSAAKVIHFEKLPTLSLNLGGDLIFGS